MNPGDRPALDLAIASFLAPGMFWRLRQSALPEDLLLLLRIAGGDRLARDSAMHASGQRQELVVEAARLYIQQVMFHPGSDSYRVLGVSRQATDERIKEHYRWLVHWLHPDHHGEDWTSVYADRVNLAWRDLRTPQRRAEYDARLSDAVRPKPVSATDCDPALDPRGQAFATDGDCFFSTHTVRRLPLVVLGGLTLTAVSALGLQYALTHEPPAPEPELAIPVRMPALLISPLLPEKPSERHMPSAPSVSAMAAEETPPEPARMVAPAPVPVRPVAAPLALKPALAPEKTKSTAAPVASRPPKKKVRSKPAPAPDIVATSSAPVPVPVPTQVQLSDDDHAAQELLRRFREAYASGDIEQVRALLTTRALGLRSDRRRIIRTYRELFDASASRRIRIDSPMWLFEDGKATVVASYQTWVVPHGQTRGHSVTGDMRLELRREKGQLRIVRLRHQPHLGVSLVKREMSQE